MRLQELITESARALNEYGRRGFPGYGMGLFRKAYYYYMAAELCRVSDEHAREFLTNWCCEMFERDNREFNTERFKAAVASGKVSAGRSAVFQQRHFYYLAQWVKEIADPHVREFVQNWLADVAGGTNPQFQRARWDEFCTPDSEKVKPAKTGKAKRLAVDDDAEPLEEYGGPGYGTRGHGGFGNKIFVKSFYLNVASDLGRVRDAAVRDHLCEWWCGVFKLDNPAFAEEAFKNAVQGRVTAKVARWQQRHFYFVAHEIAEVKDSHEREFLCHWFAENIGSTNEYFQIERWEKYCNMGDDAWEKKSVASSRERAMGKSKPVPATVDDAATL